MKKLFVLFIILFSAQGFAETKNYKCEEDTYILEWHDYDSEWNESCRSFIKDAMKKKNCSEKTLERASNSNVTEIRDGSSLVCI